MSYSLKLNDISESSISSDKKSSHFILPNNLGYMNSTEEVISNHICLFKENTTLYKDLELVSNTSFDSSIIMLVTFQDRFLSYDSTTKSEISHLENGIVIEYKNKLNKSFMMKKNTQNKNVGIVIKKSFLENNLFSHLRDKQRLEIEKNEKKGITTLFKSSLANAKTLSLAKEIYNSPFDGMLNNIYLQSRVYEIIHNEFLSLINEKDNKQKIILSQKDIEALHKAKKLILENKRNFSLDELSKKTALNQTKLKYGFKQLFNTTPGNIMLEAKMYEAKKLLETSEYNVTEIAQITGYKYIQSFTRAFIKFFGIPPSEIMKNRKYYY